MALQLDDTHEPPPVRSRTVLRRPGKGAPCAVALGVPPAAALLLGLWKIGRGNSMWRDESVTYQVARRPLGSVWGLLGNIDAVHGLYYLLMHGIFSLFGANLLTLRLPSVVAMATATAAVVMIGRDFAGNRAGVMSGLSFVLLPLVQQYSQEGRPYALVCAAVGWATYLFLRAVTYGRQRTWLGYVLLSILSCWLNEFAVLAVLSHGLALGWCLRGAPLAARLRRAWIKSAAAVMVGVSPLAVVSSRQAGRQLGWLGRPTGETWLQFAVITMVGLLLAVIVSSPADPVLVGGPAALAVFSCALLIVPSLLLLTVSLATPWFIERYVLYGMIGLALLIGTALERGARSLHGRNLRITVGAALLASAVLGSVLVPWSLLVRSPQSRKDDVIAIAGVVRAHESSSEAVLFLPARRREWLLASPYTYRRLDDLALAESPVISRTLEGVELPADEIRRRMVSQSRIIALADPPGQPLDTTQQEVVKRQTLRHYFQLCGTFEARGARILVYSRKAQAVDGVLQPLASPQPRDTAATDSRTGVSPEISSSVSPAVPGSSSSVTSVAATSC